MKHQPFFVAIANFPIVFRVNFRIRLLWLAVLLIAGQPAIAQSKYIRKYRPMADSLSAVYKIPASVMLGVAILESGSGTSRNCKLLNNHFGIVGKNNVLKTKGIKTRYKQYPDSLASYVDFCKVIQRKKFYKKLRDNMDHKLWVDAISKAGYSEVPEYWKTKVLETIRKNKLSAFN
jgi:Bax protein